MTHYNNLYWYNYIKVRSHVKIAHVQVIPKLSGVQQISLDILKSIKNENIQKYIICGENIKFSFKEAFENAGVEIITIPSLRRDIGFHDLICFFKLISIFRKYKFDIVHTNSTKPGIIARIAAKIAGIKKIIHTVHGIAFHKHAGFVTRFIYIILENFATLFGNVNISVNKNYVKYYPFVKTKVIYNGVNFTDLNPVRQNRRNLSKCIHFAFLGRLDEQKNPLQFIRAAKIVLDNINDQSRVSFTLAGGGELESDCKNLIDRLAIQDKVAMLGWITDKDSFFNSIDVLCQPSRWEAFGLVFVEASYYSIPSIATSVEGIPEVIKDGFSGLLYHGDEFELSQCMMSYINTPEEILIMGDNAKKYSCHHFNKKRMIDEYFKIYDIE